MCLSLSLLALCVWLLIIATPTSCFRQSTAAPRDLSISRTAGGIVRPFVVFSEKRHKEALLGKKFRTVGRSSQKRHYRLVGRGGGIPRLHKVSGMPTKRIALPARRCMLLGKMDNTKARSISHSGKRTHRVQKVNLQWKRIWCISRGHYVRLRLSTKGLKTIKRFGLEEAARRFNLNLNNPKLFGGYANLKPKKPKKKIVDDNMFMEQIPIDS
ncbi:50S ribosomal subunit protein L28, putative [Babesia bigemina]|uniref:Large ribosomal subunit protein bL28c n=1 Tax=Babesia bigemina TaxID=5866 RepID=A0A061CZE5_BABBI|nr:50S ribosomal subunit protein L28, putative [Babesia bigemina]CDR93996.1 50S ribosomal subunit protein L28, putative [Babesia bigemina]|eukprot:XP_012766182.1 50S ribosomal subunit protein L28, putative [Babesia bigemina]